MTEAAEKTNPALWETVKKEITAGDKGGDKGGDTHERYLPKQARDALSDEEYARTTTRKRADTRKGKQFSAQPADVAEKVKPYRDHRTRADLYAEAKKRDVAGRSRMTRAELAETLKN